MDKLFTFVMRPCSRSRLLNLKVMRETQQWCRSCCSDFTLVFFSLLKEIKFYMNDCGGFSCYVHHSTFDSPVNQSELKRWAGFFKVSQIQSRPPQLVWKFTFTCRLMNVAHVWSSQSVCLIGCLFFICVGCDFNIFWSYCKSVLKW